MLTYGVFHIEWSNLVMLLFCIFIKILYFDLVRAHKIIFGHVGMRSDDFFESRSTKATRGHPYKLFKRAPSGPHFLRNQLLICGIVYRVTLLIFRHSLLSNPQLKVLIWVIFLISLRGLVVFCTGIMCFIFQGRLLVLFFSLVTPAMCVLLVCLLMYLCFISK